MFVAKGMRMVLWKLGMGGPGELFVECVCGRDGEMGTGPSHVVPVCLVCGLRGHSRTLLWILWVATRNETVVDQSKLDQRHCAAGPAVTDVAE